MQSSPPTVQTTTSTTSPVQHRSAPVGSTVSAVPVGDFERVLKKEVARRQETSVATLLWTTVALALLFGWVTISAWMSFEHDMIFTIIHRETGDIQVWLVTREGEWKEPPVEYQLPNLDDDDNVVTDDNDDDDEYLSHTMSRHTASPPKPDGYDESLKEL
jgi:hypothetical protein